MHTATTIRTEVEQFIKRENLNFKQLADKANINVAAISSLINGNRVISVYQLDQITSVMGLSEGHYYDAYFKEYLKEIVPHWRRIKPFLYRCAELEKIDCLKNALSLLDNLEYSPYLFEVAEDFFNNNKKEAALPLYEYVAMSEKSQHSERLAICLYRIFVLQLGDNQEQNLQAALQFEPFVTRLDEIDQLDGLKDLANTYRSLHQWEKVHEVAMKLSHLAKAQYSMLHSMKKENKKPSRPWFFYVAYSQLLIGAAYYEQGNYELALQIASESADLSWIKETDEETLHWKILFQEWAQANLYLTRLMSGDTRACLQTEIGSYRIRWLIKVDEYTIRNQR